MRELPSSMKELIEEKPSQSTWENRESADLQFHASLNGGLENGTLARSVLKTAQVSHMDLKAKDQTILRHLMRYIASYLELSSVENLQLLFQASKNISESELPFHPYDKFGNETKNRE